MNDAPTGQPTRRPLPDHRPRIPADARAYGIGILGCGEIAKKAHLPAYEQHGLRVAGVWSATAASADDARRRFPAIERVHATPGDLLADPQVRVVDLATRPEHRLRWLRAAVEAGKHVLAQKPLTTDLGALEPILDLADAQGVVVAVNQNARWAPVWRLATLLVRDGAIGDVVGVTHLHDKPLPPIAGTHFDDLPHMLIVDYLMHWIDITRCWLEGKDVEVVQASDHRVPGQPADARNPWAAAISLRCADGASAWLRVVGDAHATTPGCPFWIHGTAGTIRGRILGDDHLELDRDGEVRRLVPDGAWFVDGFAGAMGELLSALDEGRPPEHAARHNVASLRLMLAARASAEQDGAPVGPAVPL
ncbi:Gfo/Idh/MocA family protein [Egicoccus sp. AB-alg6-2]|uniref:Gfo/Idh/MocA family protein n=1 Tax=Egicoccus sp. AB-alg6-2 TaxID=3242692 RepID=UPI00359ECE8E